jgi:CMP/dCMP kinase
VKVIAIDGPAGSGKSTVARRLADRLGLQYLDTGAMYRAVTFAALRRGIDPADQGPVESLARKVDLDVGPDRVTVDGVDATIEIRGPEVSRAVSLVAANAGVRTELVRRQREWATERGGGVLEGRDIGTVVFPDARLKVFLTAGEGERARRRSDEADVEQRDRLDSTRSVSPLKAADDAIVIDTTELAVDEVVARILERL